MLVSLPKNTVPGDPRFVPGKKMNWVGFGSERAAAQAMIAAILVFDEFQVSRNAK